MRTFRTFLVVTIVFGAFLAFSAGAGASVPGASTPSPKFCAKYMQVTTQLGSVRPTGSNYNARFLKTLGTALSNLAKSASGKLKSDINKMAGYFKSIGSQGSAINAGLYLRSHPSAVKNYSSAVSDFLTAGAHCIATTTSTPTATS
jgi:hypothetical protein